MIYCLVDCYNNNNNNNNNNKNNNNNNNNRAYPNSCSGQRALTLIGWFERAFIMRGGPKAQKQQPHCSSFKFRSLDWRTSYLN